jgi:hypothetical protein
MKNSGFGTNCLQGYEPFIFFHKEQLKAKIAFHTAERRINDGVKASDLTAHIIENWIPKPLVPYVKS